MSDQDGLYRLLLPGDTHPLERGYPTLAAAMDNIAHWAGRMVGRVWVIRDGRAVGQYVHAHEWRWDGVQM
jgi:hypothetical protein